MVIEFENESQEIILQLKDVNDYLGSEKIITDQISKHLSNGIDISVIENHLFELLKHFEDRIDLTPDDTERVKYVYVTVLIKVFMKNNYWHSWKNGSNSSKNII